MKKHIVFAITVKLLFCKMPRAILKSVYGSYTKPHKTLQSERGCLNTLNTFPLKGTPRVAAILYCHLQSKHMFDPCDKGQNLFQNTKKSKCQQVLSSEHCYKPQTMVFKRHYSPSHFSSFFYTEQTGTSVLFKHRQLAILISRTKIFHPRTGSQYTQNRAD